MNRGVTILVACSLLLAFPVAMAEEDDGPSEEATWGLCQADENNDVGEENAGGDNETGENETDEDGNETAEEDGNETAEDDGNETAEEDDESADPTDAPPFSISEEDCEDAERPSNASAGDVPGPDNHPGENENPGEEEDEQGEEGEERRNDAPSEDENPGDERRR